MFKKNIEQIREQKRNIDRSIRNVDREKKRMENEEKKMKNEIKKMAMNNQHVKNILDLNCFTITKH